MDDITSEDILKMGDDSVWHQNQIYLEEEAMRKDGVLNTDAIEEPINGQEPILKSRPYQSELEDIAQKRNTIIYLPTGSGKTFIAIRVIKRFKKSLQAPWGAGGKRTFFLVNTVTLVEQQRKSIERNCPVNGVNGYTGDNNVDYWNKSKWDEELSNYQVIVMTTQILADMLQHGYIKINDINLIIFDECHHASADHPMRIVMKYFDNYPVHEHPRILGLTATLLNKNIPIQNVAHNIRDLERTLRSTIATVNEMGEVLDFSTCPTEHIFYYQSCVENSASIKANNVLDEIIQMSLTTKLPEINCRLDLTHNQKLLNPSKNKFLNTLKNLVVEMKTYISELGVFGGSLGIFAFIILFERLKRAANRHEVLILNSAITTCTLARRILEDSMKNERGYQKLEKHSSQQILLMLDLLKQYNPQYKGPGPLNKAKKKFCGIIFTQQRFKAKLLYNLLKYAIETNPNEFDFLKHDFIVGCTANPMKQTREVSYIKKINTRMLTKFSNGDLNCLIGTNLIEEGLDIPQCTMVLRYDPIVNYRSYIQSKGRARNSESDFVIMVAKENEATFKNSYINFQKTEKYLESILVGSTDQRSAPQQRDVNEHIPSYKNPYSENMLTAVSAISLLNRYCSKLPHDQFSLSTPQCILEDIESKVMITIVLPITSPIRENIAGHPMISIKNAKRSACLETCIKLHEAGELDRITMLPIAYCKVDYNLEDVQGCFKNWRDEDQKNKIPGTKKMIRKHMRQYPKCLSGPGICDGPNKMYLHLINIRPMFEMPEDSRERTLYNILNDNSEGYGFLTFHPVPHLCNFPLYQTVGDSDIEIKVNYQSFVIDANQFHCIKEFHIFMFDEVLCVAKRFMVYNGKQNSLYVVPTILQNGVYDINWDHINTFKQIVPIVEPPLEKRRNLNINFNDYDQAIVTPWYRSTALPDIYLVSKVDECKTPASLLDSCEDATFASYYISKYDLEVVGPMSQPMLEVRNITTKMNCLLPRTEKLRSLSIKQQKQVSQAQGEYNRTKGDKEYFVPEFCVLQKFPGSLWFKGTLLPSIVHRVTMLLLADELRSTIAQETGIGVATLPQDMKWKPIELNIDFAARAALMQIDSRPEQANFDRINNPQDDSLPQPVNTMSMKDSLHKLKLKSIDDAYSWDPLTEPMDIERNLMSTTLMDIECYDEFISYRETTPATTTPTTPPGPPPRVESVAIMGVPIDDKGTIHILTQAPSLLGPELRDIVAALTTIKSCDTFNLERPETLGDSFLKFASTLYLFHKFPKYNEGQLSNIKGRLIGNRNLFYAGERINLGGMMKTETFSPRQDFDLPGFGVPSNILELLNNKQVRPTLLIGVEFSRSEIINGCIDDYNYDRFVMKINSNGEVEPEPPEDIQPSMQCYVGAQAVRDKNIADCVEALIGTYLISSGIPGATKILEWLRIIPEEDDLSGYYHKKMQTAYTKGELSASDLNYYLNSCQEDVERIMDYKFKDPSFLLEALSHPSYINNRATRSYERLEFLGDAILDFLVTSYIYENNEDLKPGELTELRSSLVNNTTFAAFAVRLGLQKYMCSQFNPALDSAIMKFVEHQEIRNHQVEEDIIFLIDEEDCKIVEYVEVPKCLSDIFEALAGAIYMDSCGDLVEVWRVFYKIMKKEIYMFSKNIPRQPVQVLHEMIHACPNFGKPRLMNEYTSSVMIPITITKNGKLHIAYGCGANKFQAKRAAAKLALKLLSV